jgi:hypothetical protein
MTIVIQNIPIRDIPKENVACPSGLEPRWQGTEGAFTLTPTGSFSDAWFAHDARQTLLRRRSPIVSVALNRTCRSANPGIAVWMLSNLPNSPRFTESLLVHSFLKSSRRYSMSVQGGRFDFIPTALQDTSNQITIQRRFRSGGKSRTVAIFPSLRCGVPALRCRPLA